MHGALVHLQHREQTSERVLLLSKRQKLHNPQPRNSPIKLHISWPSVIVRDARKAVGQGLGVRIHIQVTAYTFGGYTEVTSDRTHNTHTSVVSRVS